MRKDSNESTYKIQTWQTKMTIHQIYNEIDFNYLNW